jgi:hypothetical protein
MDEQNKEQTTLAVKEPTQNPNAVTMWNDAKLYNQSLSMAQTLSKSEIIPQSYKGKPADCLIAIDIANRLGLSPAIVMQNSQIVRGNFTWRGSACKAMIDGCGRYQKTRYVYVGEEGKDSYGCYLEAIDNDGDIVKGVPVTIAMAKKEGWYNKDGSKWQSMCDLMLKYRAAAFFMRTECASIAMGFLTKEEVEDVYGKQTIDNQKASVVDMLDEEINGEVVE